MFNLWIYSVQRCTVSCVDKINLNPPLFFWRPLSSQERSNRSCIWVLAVSCFVSFGNLFSIGFWSCSDNVVFCFPFIVKLWFHYYGNIFSYRSYPWQYTQFERHTPYLWHYPFFLFPSTIILQQLEHSITLHITLCTFYFVFHR
jgi:hypothetical protein